MTIDELKALTRAVVAEARRVSAAHTDQPEAPVNYACIFAHSTGYCNRARLLHRSALN
jgi:hypothetical protein